MTSSFNPEVFRWARESAGFTPEEAARCIGLVPASLAAIEQGNKAPSRANLTKMAKVYRRSLLTLYLPAPPQKGDRGEDFRTVVAERTVEAEAEVDALVRDLRARQNLVRTVLEDEEGTRPLDFVGSANMKMGITKLCKLIEQQLRLTRIEFRQENNAEAAFALLRDRAEQAGIFVLLAGNLGSHHSEIPVEAFRGLAIADPIAPFIVINNGDAKAAWSFTLLHELTHLWLGATGVSGGGFQDKSIERFCNDVAGEFLLPLADAESINVAGLHTDAQIALIADCATRWRISRQMVAYGLYKANRITLDAWKVLEAAIRDLSTAERMREKELARSKKKKSGPSYYVIRRHRLGHAMLDFASRAMGAGTLSPVKAAKVLGVKPRSVYPLLANAP
jgi:Zn-dependent peptidase ImmA (M78 family)/transcriptional regulator with XRE-family HTH domain